MIYLKTLNLCLGIILVPIILLFVNFLYKIHYMVCFPNLCKRPSISAKKIKPSFRKLGILGLDLSNVPKNFFLKKLFHPKNCINKLQILFLISLCQEKKSIKKGDA